MHPRSKSSGSMLPAIGGKSGKATAKRSPANSKGYSPRTGGQGPMKANHNVAPLHGMGNSNSSNHSPAPPQQHSDSPKSSASAVFENDYFKQFSRVIQTCSAQMSCSRLIHAIEELAPTIISSDTKASHGKVKMRVLLLHKNRFFTASEPDKPIDATLGFSGHVCKQKEIVNITNPSREPMFSSAVDHIDRKAPPANAFVCVPVFATHPSTGAKEVVAVLQAARQEPFTTENCISLYRCGSFMGNLVRNALKADSLKNLYNSTLEAHKRNSSLIQVSKAVASETEQDKVIATIAAQVPELLNCDRCTLFLVGEGGKHLIVRRGASQGRRKTLVSWIFGQSNAPELPFEEGSDELKFPISGGLVGYVATTGNIINIMDAHLDSRFDNSMDKRTGYRTRSILTIPMIDSEDNVQGVVQAINKNPLYPKGFDADDEAILSSFSAQAALAVRNALLFANTQKALRQSDALLEVAKGLSRELKLGRLMQIVCTKVQDLLECERCTIFIVDREKQKLYTSAEMSHGMGAPLKTYEEKSVYTYFPMDRGIAGAVATTGKMDNIPDAYQDKRFNQSYDKETGFRTRSILCIPLVSDRPLGPGSSSNSSNQQVLAVLQCINKKTKRNINAHTTVFNDKDESVIKAFAAQAVVAIETNLLFEQTEKALNTALADQRNLKFMLSVTRNMFSEMHLMSLIEQLTMQVHHLLKADDSALFLVDLEAKPMTFYNAKGESPTRHDLSVGIIGHVLRTGEIIRISSGAHKHALFDPIVDQREGKVTHSVLCCPIKVENKTQQQGKPQCIGVICVRDEQDRGGFEAEEEGLLQVFCAQAAVAIINSKNFSNLVSNTNMSTSQDSSAMEYLKDRRGMVIANQDVDNFFYQMSDLNIMNKIGVGSYGEVYKASFKKKPGTLAVKKLFVGNLRADRLDAFCSEASLMCQLDNENIVKFMGAVTDPTKLSIITEFCSRGSLADLLLDPKIKMDFKLKLKCCLESAKGMHYLHTSNPVILHRDLKSDNLLVDANWVIKVGDFGLTRFMSKKQMTQVGTPMWMAPEIIMGKTYTEKADVYAFGIILWEILTRLEPYETKEPMQIVLEVVNDGLRPTIPDSFTPSPLVPLMKECWNQDPSERPMFKAVVDRLEKLVAEHQRHLATKVKIDPESGHVIGGRATEKKTSAK
jgi:GAF domain-containing protein